MINTAHRNLARDTAGKAPASKASKAREESETDAERDDDDAHAEADDVEEDELGGDDDNDAKNPSPSDVAHAETSFFFTAHRAMLSALPGAATLQIHGFQDEKVEGAGVVLSAALTRADTAGIAARLRAALTDQTVQVYPADVQKLGGTFNVEARASREANAPFFHVELSRTLRDKLVADEVLRARFARALDPLSATTAPPSP
jgi:hypothetical protein